MRKFFKIRILYFLQYRFIYLVCKKVNILANILSTWIKYNILYISIKIYGLPSRLTLTARILPSLEFSLFVDDERLSIGASKQFRASRASFILFPAFS